MLKRRRCSCVYVMRVREGKKDSGRIKSTRLLLCMRGQRVRLLFGEMKVEKETQCVCTCTSFEDVYEYVCVP